MKKILIIYFSRTGVTAGLALEAAKVLDREGFSVQMEGLRPKLALPYPLWLLLSFFPGMKTGIKKLKANPASYDGLVLAFPKWTFACPPVEGFLARQGTRLPPTALLVSMGGWDGERYLYAYGGRLLMRGVKVVERLLFKRGDVTGAGRNEALAALARLPKAFKDALP